MLISCMVTYYQDSIAGAWKFLIAIGAGTGSVFILRWFWWRINAWSEVFAMGASFCVSMLLQLHFKLNNDDPRQFAWIVIITVLCSTVIWLVATFLTAPEKQKCCFLSIAGCGPALCFGDLIARKAADVAPRHDGACNLLDWACGCVLVYMTLFGVGKIIFGQSAAGLGFLAVASDCRRDHLSGSEPSRLEVRD